jgi:hypothetical protein
MAKHPHLKTRSEKPREFEGRALKVYLKRKEHPYCLEAKCSFPISILSQRDILTII